MAEQARTSTEQLDMLAEIHALIDELADEIRAQPLGTLRIDWSPSGPKGSMTKYINRNRKREQLSA